MESSLKPAFIDNLPLFQISVAGLPIAIGMAILKYRLYDIDLIIRRTLLYSILTAMLALIYFGSIVLLQLLFGTVTGEFSPVEIAISTLAIAFLFTPLRRGLQDFIDRRFYRRKYDTAHALQAFGLAARNEVELDKLSDELLSVISETMQPTQVSLWLAHPDLKVGVDNREKRSKQKFGR